MLPCTFSREPLVPRRPRVTEQEGPSERAAARPPVPTPAEEEALVAACLAGDRAAWRRLVSRYEGVIFAIPRRYGLTDEDAAEVFQNVCLALYRGLPRLRLAAGLTRWVLVTTRRQARDLARRRRREVPDPDGSAALARPDDAPLADSVLEEMETRIAVRAALGQLTGRCREMIEWLYLAPDTPSYKEIARRLEIPEGTVGPTRARCLERLRALLEKARKRGY